MKNIMMIVLTFMVSILVVSCSATPQEPYYDRVKNASQDAHKQLRRD